MNNIMQCLRRLFSPAPLSHAHALLAPFLVEAERYRPALEAALRRMLNSDESIAARSLSPKLRNGKGWGGASRF